MTSSVFFKCPGRRRNSAIDLVVLTLERCIYEQENTNAYTTVSRHPLILKGSLFAANLGKKNVPVCLTRSLETEFLAEPEAINRRPVDPTGVAESSTVEYQGKCGVKGYSAGFRGL